MSVYLVPLCGESFACLSGCPPTFIRGHGYAEKTAKRIKRGKLVTLRPMLCPYVVLRCCSPRSSLPSQVFAVKTWDELASYDGCGGSVTSVKFGKSASTLVRRSKSRRKIEKYRDSERDRDSERGGGSRTERGESAPTRSHAIPVHLFFAGAIFLFSRGCGGERNMHRFEVARQQQVA